MKDANAVGGHFIRDIYDLNLHLEGEEVCQKVSVPSLQKHVQSLAEELDATDYYCGYDPAVDADTRLFTGGILGPFKNWKSEE